MDWEMNHDDCDSPDLFRVDSWQKKALEILKDALKREMLNDNVDWNCVHSYVTACPTLCGEKWDEDAKDDETTACLLYTSPSPRDGLLSRMPSSA